MQQLRSSLSDEIDDSTDFLRLRSCCAVTNEVGYEAVSAKHNIGLAPNTLLGDLKARTKSISQPSFLFMYLHYALFDTT